MQPRDGWRAWIEDEAVLLVRNGAVWQPVIPTALDDLTRLGIGMAASAGAPFSAKLNSALWTALYAADGGNGDLTQTLNREATGNDAGLILQTGFSTRALIGMFGSDQFRIAVSPDGSSFRDALGVDPATGIADQPNLPRFKAYTNYDNYVATDSWTTLGINVAEYNDQGCFDAATNRFVAPVAGTYLLGASLHFKINASSNARMRGRLVLNGSTEIRGSLGEISGAHVSEATALWLQAMVSTLLASRWARRLFVWTALIGAVLLFLLNLRRAGETAGRHAERLKQMERQNDIQRRMLEASST